VNALYFGCSGSRQLGHFFFLPGMKKAGRYEAIAAALPFERIDGALCPPTNERRHYDERQPEGVAKVTRQGGWTALAFWDRSVDHRHGSNSTFFLEGDYDYEGALALARDLFPEVFARFAFEVTPA
jgi:hypothetical protein